KEAEFVVMGMGKLGGGELNFSSDIDILYIYSSDNGETEGVAKNGRITGRIDLHTFYIKLSRTITRLVSDITEDGFCFRVDLDLRPEGRNGDMANSMRSAEIYYESWGETWERSALIKARPVAGSISLGEDFLKMVKPFVYRRYLDFTAVDEIKGMKERIDISLLKDKKGFMDVKLGRGGIREVEFFIQTMQLINGGRDSCIRDKNTLVTIARLKERGYISDEEETSLKRAYIFMRNVEHRLQILHGRQTHSLPDHVRTIEILAKGLGFTENPYENFMERLKIETEDVHRVYNRLFYEPAKQLEEDTLKELIYLSQDEDGVLVRLSDYGFLEPKKAIKNLRLLKDGPPFAHYPARAKTLLQKIAPFLLTKIISSPAPDMALANMERFISSVGARRSLLSLLAENKGIMELMVRLFGTSAFLSRFIIEHPELLDSFITHETGGLLEGKDAVYKTLSGMVDQVSDYEDRLDALRRFRNIEILEVGIMDILGDIDSARVSDHITDLADASLQKAYYMAREELTKRFGAPSYRDKDGNCMQASFSILGLGKLGGRELIYGSDLDIIFVYSHSGETMGRETRVISNHEFFARLAQRIISIISLITPEGFVFKMDTRLRPSGSSGPLVTSFEAFEKYHREKAAVWERQALLKMRSSAGDRGFGEDVVSLAQELIYCKPLLMEDEQEIHRLRMRMERELGKETDNRIDIKFGEGGLVDIEFLVQFLQLRHGNEMGGVRGANTLKVLDGLKEARLIVTEDYHLLKDAYSFYRLIENRLRIVEDRASSEVIFSDPGLERLYKGLGFKDSEGFVKKYMQQRKEVRETYKRIFGLA
ncbi:MAG: bifunctional [glutamate--ammonia ligase]-adenylyl-L-tyrosine phosphorylase/[glutamate--ammonia-ligase] adenylyltransferase, partial [Thermodesulfobacteriota bacterium]